LPQNVASLRFDAPEKLVGPLLRTVRQRADVVVVLCHFGGEQAEDGTIRGPIADLARAAHGADAVIGGHTHTWVAGIVDGIPVMVAGSNGRCLGRIVLEVDGKRAPASSPVLLRAYSDSLQVPAWDPIAVYVSAVHQGVAPQVSRVLGQAARRLGRNELANLVTDAMRAAAHADVAITNPGGLRRDLEPGPITVGDVFELLPFENALVTMRMSGTELRAVIASRPEKALLSGLRGSWNPQAPADSQLVLVRAGGKPIEPDSIYAVVTNSFLDQGGDGFKGFEAGRERVVSNRMLRDVVDEAITAETQAGRAIDPDSSPRLRLPPRAGR
jgi:2',3'-cyclic-nucleotide 2'-phosphodiesterase/3'-nucleotidase